MLAEKDKRKLASRMCEHSTEIERLTAERDQARALARAYSFDIEHLVSAPFWQEHWGDHASLFPWLKEDDA